MVLHNYASDIALVHALTVKDIIIVKARYNFQNPPKKAPKEYREMKECSNLLSFYTYVAFGCFFLIF